MAEIHGTRDALNQQNIINFKCLIKNKCKWHNEMAHYLFTDELNALIIPIAMQVLISVMFLQFFN